MKHKNNNINDKRKIKSIKKIEDIYIIRFNKEEIINILKIKSEIKEAICFRRA